MFGTENCGIFFSRCFINNAKVSIRMSKTKKRNNSPWTQINRLFNHFFHSCFRMKEGEKTLESLEFSVEMTKCFTIRFFYVIPSHPNKSHLT